MVNSEIVVNVTRENIKNGIPNYGSSCAISKAICRKYKKSPYYLNLCTDDSEIVINDRTYIPVNQREKDKLRRFVNNFDNEFRRHFCRPMRLKLKLEK